MMRAIVVAIGTMLVGAALATPAAAQDTNSCRYGGRRYASGQAICQAGQVQLCVGGEWQGNGTFCDGGANGAYVGAPALGPGQVDLDEGRRPDAPIQNAPIDEDE